MAIFSARDCHDFLTLVNFNRGLVADSIKSILNQSLRAFYGATSCGQALCFEYQETEASFTDLLRGAEFRLFVRNAGFKQRGKASGVYSAAPLSLDSVGSGAYGPVRGGGLGPNRFLDRSNKQ
ncbi:hypothetical protein G9X68_15020 [Rhizobium sp. WYCCWR 11279]|uniref:hypothetical protein n=1 Tax=Rhizobium changzhiense TaxID=2692317 RepID=UPI0014929975|nr:hypothetical protein [Rhizobium changzhiense]NNU48418.1 hypothetical protein [Rhizobium changzhiense]